MTDEFRQPMKKSSLKGDWIKMSLGFAILVLNSRYWPDESIVTQR